MKRIFIFLLLALMTAPGAGLAQVSGAGPYTNDPSIIADGYIPDQGTAWTDNACVYWNGTGTFFTIDLGRVALLETVTLQVDNNDDYAVEYSTDGRNFRSLFFVRAAYGEVGWGMDTLSTDPQSPDYVREIAFRPVKAQFIKIRATGGDDCYAVSELSISDSGYGPPPSPPPAQSGHVTSFGPYTNAPSLITDGYTPNQGTGWTDNACVYWNGTRSFFTIDLGRMISVEAVTLQVDNNDDYAVEYSADGRTFRPLFNIRSAYGEVGWGMDTLSTDPQSPDFVREIAFRPVKARFIKIRATGGDDCYAVSELSVTGRGGHQGEAPPPPPAIQGGVSGYGPYTNDPSIITDGHTPNQGTGWTDNACVYWNGTGTFFTIDLGRIALLEAVTLQVDNNDDYAVEYSTDGRNFRSLFFVRAAYGEVGWGMDTLSTDPKSPDYVQQLSFRPVKARFIKIRATGGDNSYAVSEMEIIAR